MSKQGKIIVGGMLFIYGIHLVIRFSEYSSPLWLNSYLADLLCMPILLSLSLLSLRYLKRLPHFLFKPVHVLFALLYVSLVFEWLLPSYSSSYTADPLDLLMYGLGAGLFFALQPAIFPEKSLNAMQIEP